MCREDIYTEVIVSEAKEFTEIEGRRCVFTLAAFGRRRDVTRDREYERLVINRAFVFVISRHIRRAKRGA